MRLLAVVSKLTGVSITVESSEVNLNTSSIVKLSVALDEISQLTRINHDLVVTLHSGETIMIKNFYVTNDLGTSQLVLAERDSTLWWVENPQAGLHYETGNAVWPLVLAGAVTALHLPAAVISSYPPPDGSYDGNSPSRIIL